MKSLELRWGLIIGGVNLLWLYGSFYAGMHTNGLGLVQAMGLVGLIITFFGYLFGLRAVQSAQPEITWVEGVKSGAMIAGVAALIAVLAQAGYLLFIHPEWPEVIAEETRKLNEGGALSEEQLDSLYEETKAAFGLKANLLRAGIGAVFFGSVFSMVIMAFLRRLQRK
ncbi:MAG: DUF4199 domain-containing protein [Verrucomicrobiales bacterium]|nr:DUF4199 domain-containing protein [Verrucomicrobiales bacterium]